jgi:hypothetical protein
MMAQYQITLKVDGTRKEFVEKALRKAFGDDAPVFTVEKVKTPESRAARLAEAEAMADDARQIVEELKEEMEQWRDSIPENLQSGDKYSQVDDCCTNLDDLHSNLEQCEFGSIDFPGMF